MSQNELVLKLILLMAFADAEFKNEEKDYINYLCKQLNISNDKYQKILIEVNGSLDFFVSSCRETARAIIEKNKREIAIQFLSEMIAKDKIVHKTEIFILHLIAEEWDMYMQDKNESVTNI